MLAKLRVLMRVFLYGKEDYLNINK